MPGQDAERRHQSEPRSSEPEARQHDVACGCARSNMEMHPAHHRHRRRCDSAVEPSGAWDSEYEQVPQIDESTYPRQLGNHEGTYNHNAKRTEMISVGRGN